MSPNSNYKFPEAFIKLEILENTYDQRASYIS